MEDYDVRMLGARAVVDKARACDIPVIFIQEIHRANLVDFGRELDGVEDIHCLDNNPETDLAREQMGFVEGDYHIQKRRYSAFSMFVFITPLLMGINRITFVVSLKIVLQVQVSQLIRHRLMRWNICKRVPFVPLKLIACSWA